MREEFEYLVVGKGLWGSAAARHLSAISDSVAIIGPDEPQQPESHDGIFASHYDQGRLTLRIDTNPVWMQAAVRAIDRYAALEAASGIRFHTPSGLLLAYPSDVETGTNPHATAVTHNLPHDFYPAGHTNWRTHFPYLDFPDSHWVLYEPPPTGHINPRKLLQAQLQVAQQQGATIIREIATAVSESPEGVVVTTRSGDQVQAQKVLLAMGAYTNLFGLLERPLAITVETETIILAEVSAAQAERLADMPCLIYEIDDPDISDIYLTPPIIYPDGRFYIKMGANTPADLHPTTLDGVQEWFHNGASDAYKASLTAALQAMLPTVEFRSITTKRCIITRTANRCPMIDQVSDHIYVAAGANGKGAKGSDTWGWLAAQLMGNGRWWDVLPRDLFKAQYL